MSKIIPFPDRFTEEEEEGLNKDDLLQVLHNRVEEVYGELVGDNEQVIEMLKGILQVGYDVGYELGVSHGYEAGLEE